MQESIYKDSIIYLLITLKAKIEEIPQILKLKVFKCTFPFTHISINRVTIFFKPLISDFYN